MGLGFLVEFFWGVGDVFGLVVVDGFFFMIWYFGGKGKDSLLELGENWGLVYY